MQKFPYKCLYLIKHSETGLVKIGISNNWYARAKALQVGTKTFPLAVVLTNNNKQAESSLHDQYRYCRLPGSEYFQLNGQGIGEVVSAALKYGKPLSDWRHPPKHTCPARALLRQDYVEVTCSFHRELLRQLRLNYAQRIMCILEHLDKNWDEEAIRKFTVYLDIQVQRTKIKRREQHTPRDWYLRLEACEAYLQRLFSHLRIFVPQTLPTYTDPNFTLLSCLCFTTVKTGKAIPHENLPLIARIIFQCLWHEYDLYSNFRKIQDSRHKEDEHWFEHYLESYGPYHYTVGKPLPKPVFADKINMGKSI